MISNNEILVVSENLQKQADKNLKNSMDIIETFNVRQKTIGELQELIEKLNKQLEAVKEALK